MERFERLKFARLRCGFRSASAAAAYLSIPYGTYSGHENGSRGIKEIDLLRYASAFKVSPSWLAFGVNAKKQKINVYSRAGSLRMNETSPLKRPAILEIDPPFPIDPDCRALIVPTEEFAPSFLINDVVLIAQNQTPSSLINIRCAALIDQYIFLGQILSVEADKRCHFQLPSGKMYLDVRTIWAAPIVAIITPALSNSSHDMLPIGYTP